MGRRACAEDGAVAETWVAAAAAVDPRICAAFAWAASQRLANDRQNALLTDDGGASNNSVEDSDVDGDERDSTA